MQSRLNKLYAQGFFERDIEAATISNTAYRRVVHTTQQIQFVLMCLQAGEEIGAEVHPDTTQFFRVEQGEGRAIVNDVVFPLQSGSVVIVPAGAEHNIVNTSRTSTLNLYTIYSPPHHPPNTLQQSK